MACDVLYNVNSILVTPCLVNDYIQFSNQLNQYLIKKYGRYYIGLQLYEDNNVCNSFYVIASYRNIPGLYEAIKVISNDISNIYEKVWGDKVERTSVFSFTNYKKII